MTVIKLIALMALKKQTNKKQNKLMAIVITMLIVTKIVYKPLRIAK